MYYIEIKQIKPLIDKGYKIIKVTRGEYQQLIFLKKVQIRYGVRTFFICPCCGKNALRLYIDKNMFKCVRCSTVKPYYGIQNTTKGGYEYISYKMERFANKCGIGDFKYPFDYKNHPKPKGKHIEKWTNNLKIMQALENMRLQSIVYNKIWNLQIIKSVEQGRNKFLILSLSELERYFYPFDTGV